MYKIEVLSEVNGDMEKLSDRILNEVFEYFEKYETEPYKYSQTLHNKFGLELEGYRKTYVANASYRIVIKIENGVAKIVEVVAVGKRKNKEVYKITHERVQSNKK